ncbi:dihydrodipicolinate synthase family protein [Bacteroidota bacterium]
MKLLNGIIAVCNTPFTKDNRIDTASIRRYVNTSINNGVVGFLSLGIAAEVNKLSIKEKQIVLDTVVGEVNNRVPVIGSTWSKDLEEVKKMIRLVEEYGCDIVLLNIPYTNKEEYTNNLLHLTEYISKDLMIQDWDFDGYGLPIDLITKLFDEIDHFKYLKVEVQPAGVKYSEVLEATNNKLHVSGDWAGTQMIEALDRGVHAFMPTILHDVYRKIFELHSSGNRKKAVVLFNKLLPIISFSHQHLDISVHFNKRLVHKQGIFDYAHVREPILKFDDFHEQVSDELINYALDLSNQINSN